MSVAQYADLLICPDYIADAARSTRLGLNILTNQKAFLENFSIMDAAAMLALNNHETVSRYLGFSPNGMKYKWGIQEDAEFKQFQAIEQLSKATSVTQGIAEGYLQPPPADNVGEAYRIEDLGDGIVVLIVKPGAIYAMRNDNYLMTVLKAVVERMFAFVPLDKLFLTAGSSGELVKRYLNLAAFNNQNRPPQPVFG